MDNNSETRSAALFSGRRALPALPIILVLLWLAVSHSMNYSRQYSNADFYMFWIVPRIVSEQGINNPYDPSIERYLGELYYEEALEAGSNRQRRAAEIFRQLEVNSTPFLFTAFYPLITGDYELDCAVYYGISLSVLMVGVTLMCAMLGFGILESLLFLLLLLTWCEPVRSDLRTGNVNMLQLGCLGIYIFMQNRSQHSRLGTFLAGVFLAAIVMFKPNTAFIPPLALLGMVTTRRHRRAYHLLGGLGAGIGVALLSTTWVFGSLEPWAAWINRMQHRFADYHAVQNGNCALTVLLEELTGERSVMIYLVPSVLLTIAIVGIYLAAGKIEAMKRRNIAIPEIDYTLWDTTIFSLGLLMGVLWAKPAWVHYFILCIPALLVIACPIRWNMKTWPLIALFLTFALSFPSLFAPLYGASMDLSYAVHFVALTVVLLAALLWKLYDDQEELGIPRAAPRRVN